MQPTDPHDDFTEGPQRSAESPDSTTDETSNATPPAITDAPSGTDVAHTNDAGIEPAPNVPRTDLTPLRAAVDRIRSAIGSIIVGQGSMVELLITALLAEGHALIEGAPGVAKTMTAKLTARSVAAGFSRIQFTPDLMPSDLLGTSIFNPKTQDFTLKRGPIFSNIILIDEINRAPAKTQAALFEVMEERQITIDGVTHRLERPFMVIATQNPIEHEGTYRLPEAQLDRFLFKINVGYPTVDEETAILGGFHARKGVNDPHTVEPVLDAAELRAYQDKVKALHIDEKLIRYIAEISAQTRANSALYLGASPRASLAMLSAAKAYAAVSGRDFVIPEDIQVVVPAVLRHRIILTPEKEMSGATADDVIREITGLIEVPR